MTANNKIGAMSFVFSIAGRDSGRLFLVTEVAGDYALIADGKLRRLEKPKRKKIRHLRVSQFESYRGEMTNRAISSRIKALVAESVIVD